MIANSNNNNSNNNGASERSVADYDFSPFIYTCSSHFVKCSQLLPEWGWLWFLSSPINLSPFAGSQNVSLCLLQYSLNIFLLSSLAPSLNISLHPMNKSQNEPLQTPYKATCNFQTHHLLSRMALSPCHWILPPWDERQRILYFYMSLNRASATHFVNQMLEKFTSKSSTQNASVKNLFSQGTMFAWAASGTETISNTTRFMPSRSGREKTSHGHSLFSLESLPLQSSLNFLLSTFGIRWAWNYFSAATASTCLHRTRSIKNAKDALYIIQNPACTIRREWHDLQHAPIIGKNNSTNNLYSINHVLDYIYVHIC